MANFQEPFLDQFGKNGIRTDFGTVNGKLSVVGTGEDNVPVIGGLTDNWSSPNSINTPTSTSTNIVTVTDFPYTLPYLRGSNLGFAVPAAATLVGFGAAIALVNSSSDYEDLEVKLAWSASAANLSSANRAKLSALPSVGSTPQMIYYGGVTDMWGEVPATLTPTVVNSTDFGFVFRVTRPSGTSSRTVRVSSFRMAAYYTLSTASGNMRATQVEAQIITSVAQASSNFRAGRHPIIITSGGY